MYYTNDNESLYQQLVKNNKSDYDCLLEEVGFCSTYGIVCIRARNNVRSTFEMLIFLNDLVMDKKEM